MKKRLSLIVVKVVLGVMLCIIFLAAEPMDVKALTLEFDETTQEIIIAGVPATDDKYNYLYCRGLVPMW